MKRWQNLYFNLLYWGFIALTLFVLIYYNEFYWADYFPESGGIPGEYSFLLNIVRFFALLFILAILIFKRKIFDKKKEVCLLVISLVLGLLVLELGVRVYVCEFASSDIRSRTLLLNECDFQSIYEEHHYLSFRGVPNYLSEDGLNMHNSLGFRGEEVAVPKLDGVYRIAITGGSTTYDSEIKDWRKSSAYLLQEKLRDAYDYDGIEVVNVGMGGWNSWESLINLELNVLELEPDLLIIYEGTNDASARFVNPEKYRGDNSGFRRVWKQYPLPLPFKSMLFRFVTGISPTGLGDFLVPRDAINPLHEEGFIANLGGTYFETLEKNEPIYFERNLINMIAIAREHDMSVLLSTWAYSKEVQLGHASLPHYRAAYREHNEIIFSIGKSKEVDVYDFASEMPEDPAYWADGMHNSAEGAEKKADLFANELVGNKNMIEKISDFKAGFN